MNSETTKFDIKTSLLMSKLSCLVYETETIIEKEVPELGFTRFKPFGNEKTSTYGMVVWDDEAVVIVFRGTAELKNFVTDAEILLTDGYKGKVHTGFDTALDSVWADIRSILTPLWDEPKHRSYWLAGHSLGAALATLAAARLLFKEHDRPLHGVYTFGSPRVGNEDFSKAYNEQLKSRTFRFVNNNDIVTRVPLRITGYRHVGTFMYLTSDCKLETDIHFWNLFLDRLKGDLNAVRNMKVDQFNDHHCANYVACIKKEME